MTRGFPDRVILSKELVNWISIRAIDVYLGEHRELYVVLALRKCLYLLISAGLLPIELIAREGQYLQALLSELLVELHHFAVVAVREASLRRHVHNHDTLFSPAQIAQLATISVNIIR